MPSCIECYSCYLQQCLSIDLFPYLSVLSGDFLGIGSLVFSGTQHGVGALVVLCVTPKFFENNILPLEWGK